MRNIIFFCLFVSSMSAASVDSFQELTSTLEAGKQVMIVLDLERCMDKPGMPKGYLAPTALMHLPATETVQEHVSASHMQFTEQSGTPTYEYVKYTFNADGTVLVKVTFYDPKTFKSLGTHTMGCQLGSGVRLITQ